MPDPPHGVVSNDSERTVLHDVEFGAMAPGVTFKELNCGEWYTAHGSAQ